jgi:hypothetical protein
MIPKKNIKGRKGGAVEGQIEAKELEVAMEVLVQQWTLDLG